MLRHRVRSGVLMGLTLLAALYFLPSEGAIAVLTAVCGLALWEFYALMRAGGIPHFRGVGVAGGVALLLGTWWVHTRGVHSGLVGDIESMIFFFTAAVVFVRQMFQPTLENALQAMAGTMLGVVYVAWLFNFLNKLLLVFGFHEGRLLIFYLALVVKMTDVGAYFIGCRLGGKKFFPRISPAKTWSGVIGGMLTGLLCSVVAWHFMRGQLLHLSFDLIDAVILGLLLSAAGILGDLIESLLKRATGVKDSGTMIQGMGGLLDVVDSLIFAAPFLYIYMRLFVDITG